MPETTVPDEEVESEKEEGPIPSSSSKGPGPQPPQTPDNATMPSAADETHDKAPMPPPPVPGTPAPGTPAPGTPGRIGTPAPKVHKSPEEILGLLAPPGCTISLGYNDHRFAARYPLDSATLPSNLAKKTMSAAFAQRRSWQEALSMVHKWSWEKWELVQDRHPLPSGRQAQKPGEVSSKALEDLTPIIRDLPEVKRYSKLV